MLYLLGFYLVLGVGLVLALDAGQVKDAIKDAADLLFGIVLWPFVLIGRAKWAHVRRQYNAAAAVRRQEHLSANHLKYDPDGWWAGKDLQLEATPIWRPRDSRG